MARSMAELLRSPYFVVSLEEGRDLVRVVRTPEPFPSVEVVTSAWLDVIGALDRAGRLGRCLLTDLRPGPGRNDPAFEAAVRAIVVDLHRGFRKNAVLVRLPAAILQIRRHAREDGIERLVTDDEEAALAYLLAPGT